MPTAPLLTIVTVVKDDPEGFARTRASVTPHLGDDIEWLVVDSSTHRVDAPEATYNWTPPAGIYAAMNDGLARATGEYIYFLNAGDVITTGALPAIRAALVTRPTWAYGQVGFVQPDGRVITPRPFNYAAERRALFARGRFPAHQGTVARTEVLRGVGGFDTRYTVAADYHAMLKLSAGADPVELPDVIAEFAVGGISSTQWRHSLREFQQARREVFNPRGIAALRDRFYALRQRATMATARLLK